MEVLAVHASHRDSVVSYLESLGFETVHASSGFSNHIHSLGTRVDLLYVSGNTATELFRDTISKDLDGAQAALPVVSAEHLVALKVFAIKNDPTRKLRDAADIVQLVRIGAVSPAAVESTCQRYKQHELWEMIDAELTDS